MDFLRIPHTENKSQLTMAIMANVEFVNPIEKTMNDIIDSHKAFRLSIYRFANEHNKPSPIGILTSDEILTRLELEGLKRWKEQYDKIMHTILPESIFQILNCFDKELQIKAFKPPFKLSTLSLQKFIFQAWQLHGFKYSYYRFEYPQKGLNLEELPKGFFLDEKGEMEVYGDTKMKKGELKNAIKHRKVTIAKFLDKGPEWHCFYYNYNSINGNESSEIPHIHYISNNWTIDRQIIVEELRNRHHSFTSSVHISYSRSA